MDKHYLAVDSQGGFLTDEVSVELRYLVPKNLFELYLMDPSLISEGRTYYTAVTSTTRQAFSEQYGLMDFG